MIEGITSTVPDLPSPTPYTPVSPGSSNNGPGSSDHDGTGSVVASSLLASALLVYVATILVSDR